ncbi:MAG: 5-(carboxyamino)imidazole ribonucleotide mutase [Ignavibacteriales bacterium]|nr:5-(carboxyamino)imidazole ribonucleotide mutase [Ignavibacteriales bacterium]
MVPKRKTSDERPLVGIMMGSASDLEAVEPARTILKEFGIQCEMKVLSAHRTPDQALRYAAEAESRGIEVIIAAAGGAAHLPGVVAAKTLLPVIGIPIKSKALNGLDSLLSIVQMPAGIPVATVAIDGAANAALLAVTIMAGKHPELRAKLKKYRKTLEEKVLSAKV